MTVKPAIRGALPIAALLLLAAGCTKTNACRPGTIFLTVSYDTGSAHADMLAVSYSSAGATQATTRPRRAGSTLDTIEIAFSAGYPTGVPAQIAVTALQGGLPIGHGAVAVTLATGCTSAEVAVVSSMMDAGDLGAGGGSDLGGNPDLSQSSSDLSAGDGGVVPFCGRPASCPSGLLCDSFEGAVLDSSLWHTLESSGSIALDSARACRGSQSVHSHNNASGNSAGSYGQIYALQPFGTGSLFLRAFFFVPQANLTATGYHTLFSVNQTVGPYSSILVNTLQGGYLQLVDPAPALPISQNSQTVFPTDRWVCAEWEVDFSLSNGAIRLWLDEVPVNDLTLTGVATQMSLPISALYIGLSQYSAPSAQPALDYWFDDVLVDVARIGCSR